MTPLQELTLDSRTRSESERILHRYIVGRRGHAIPGDVALCGYVKDTPTEFPNGGTNHPGRQVCAICLEGDGQPW